MLWLNLEQSSGQEVVVVSSSGVVCYTAANVSSLTPTPTPTPSATMDALEQLNKEQLYLLRRAFDAFAQDKGYIEANMVGTILQMLGHDLPEKTLRDIIQEVDVDGSGQLEFEEFCTLAAQFVKDEEEEEDPRAMQEELREAFRLYDKEGNGYITTDLLREILSELDDKMTEEDLDNMIDEIDADGSGSVDFDEFMAVMTGE